MTSTASELLSEWINWYQTTTHERSSQADLFPDFSHSVSLHIALGKNYGGTSQELLEGEIESHLERWFQWWRETDSVPAKLENSLHVRTAIFLEVKKLEREKLLKK